MPEVKRANRRILRRVGVAALTAGLVGGAWALTFSPVFRIRAVSVGGVRHLEAAEVIARSGLAGGNAWHLDTEAVAERLERDPWVLRAVVVPRLPSGASITVLERRPLALSRTDNGTLVLVGEGGVLLGDASSAGGLPEVRGALGEPGPTELRLGAAVLDSLRPAVRHAVSAVVVALDGSAHMTLSSGVNVQWGDVDAEPESLAARARSLGAVLEWAERNETNLASVDVHVASTPTATLVGGAVVEGETAGSSL